MISNDWTWDYQIGIYHMLMDFICLRISLPPSLCVSPSLCVYVFLCVYSYNFYLPEGKIYIFNQVWTCLYSLVQNLVFIEKATDTCLKEFMNVTYLLRGYNWKAVMSQNRSNILFREMEKRSVSLIQLF